MSSVNWFRGDDDLYGSACNWVCNEADTLESSSVMIYSFQEQSIQTQKKWQKALLTGLPEFFNANNPNIPK